MNDIKTLTENLPMTSIYIGVICFLVGGLTTGGTMFAIDKRNQQVDSSSAEIIGAIATLQNKLDEANAKAKVSLTNTDLLGIPCSKEYLNAHGESLCREMFCRMNKVQGEGSTSQECDQIANSLNSQLIIDSCMEYWAESTTTERGLNQNSQYAQCIDIFGDRK
ncbi:hypothetical protein CMI47_10570 [Candidatus Pacearchaeota archaeon]|nr:hypothetical protein [Candidatus Pacearchaeota archaeon]|tara:strand:- start:3533 stop:4024 length:492 start_codon:yes stop_codon:yes gene_type:complete